MSSQDMKTNIIRTERAQVMIDFFRKNLSYQNNSIPWNTYMYFSTQKLFITRSNLIVNSLQITAFPFCIRN